jgi:hypothetical protein
MLRKAVQQGRSEWRGEEVHTALRVGRSPVERVLAIGEIPPASSDLDYLFGTLIL